jgi:hypothetical protein
MLLNTLRTPSEEQEEQAGGGGAEPEQEERGATEREGTSIDITGLRSVIS